MTLYVLELSSALRQGDHELGHLGTYGTDAERAAAEERYIAINGPLTKQRFFREWECELGVDAFWTPPVKETP